MFNTGLYEYEHELSKVSDNTSKKDRSRRKE